MYSDCVQKYISIYKFEYTKWDFATKKRQRIKTYLKEFPTEQTLNFLRENISKTTRTLTEQISF